MPLTQGKGYSRIFAKLTGEQYPYGGSKRVGGWCKPSEAVWRRHPVCCGQEMARRTPPLWETKCVSARHEFRWNRG